MKRSKLARIKQLARADAARKAKRKPIVTIEGDVSRAFKAAMLQKIADHVLAVHDDRPKRGTYKRR
jgi:hypothetical protein